MRPSSSMQPEPPVSGSNDVGASGKKPSRPAAAEAAIDASVKGVSPAASVGFNQSARALILDYLLRSCYKGTALAFAAADPLEEAPALDASVLQTLDQRASVSKLMRSGDVLAALALADALLAASTSEAKSTVPTVSTPAEGLPSVKTEKKIMTVREAMPELFFDLGCQHFVELVRGGLAGDALLFAQETLAPLAKCDSIRMSVLQDITVLLAFDEPSRSPGGALLALDRREVLAVTLNDQLYRACGKADIRGGNAGKIATGERIGAQSSLERVLRQIDVSGSQLKPSWSLKDVLL